MGNAENFRHYLVFYIYYIRQPLGSWILVH